MHGCLDQYTRNDNVEAEVGKDRVGVSITLHEPDGIDR